MECGHSVRMSDGAPDDMPNSALTQLGAAPVPSRSGSTLDSRIRAVTRILSPFISATALAISQLKTSPAAACLMTCFGSSSVVEMSATLFYSTTLS
jgi:hypothetical protein